MNLLLRVGAILGFLGVALGAFGAHALRERMPADQMAIYQTGVLYQLLHAVVITALGFAKVEAKPFRVAGWLFAAGIVLFSGSLYALAATDIKMLGAVTPLGGICFLAGWGLLVYAAVGESKG